MSSIEKGWKRKKRTMKRHERREVFEMIYENDVVRDVQIAYIGGGSRDGARSFYDRPGYGAKDGGTIQLYDIDTEAAKANETVETTCPREKKQ